MNICEALDLFLEHRRLASCAPGTIALYRRQLARFRDWLQTPERELSALSIDHLRGFFAYLRDDYVSYASEASSRPLSARPLSENTLAGYYRTLRAFWSFLATEDVLSSDQARYFARMKAPHVGDDPRPVTGPDVVRRLMDACGDGHDEESARNRAILCLLAETGMRIGELVALTDAVVDLRLRRAKVLRAKGKKHRMVFWQAGSHVALARYLLLRRGKHGGPLFRGCSIRNSGGGVTADSVRACIKRVAIEARIVLPKGAPLHSIRHGFAHAAIEHGAQLSDLADLLGHADLETTRIYVRNDDDRLAAAYDRIFRRVQHPRSARDDAESHG
jgi:site-specific recombinase XerD